MEKLLKFNSSFLAKNGKLVVKLADTKTNYGWIMIYFFFAK
jgi:hypothetical protein